MIREIYSAYNEKKRKVWRQNDESRKTWCR